MSLKLEKQGMYTSSSSRIHPPPEFWYALGLKLANLDLDVSEAGPWDAKVETRALIMYQVLKCTSCLSPPCIMPDLSMSVHMVLEYTARIAVILDSKCANGEGPMRRVPHLKSAPGR